MAVEDTFGFHLATPPGVGGVALFELYGAGVEASLSRLFRAAAGLPGDGRQRLGALVDLEGRDVDEVVIGRIPPEGMWCRLAAWTLGVHGGSWVQRRVGEVLEAAGGARWSRRDVLVRAIESGALDAVEAAAFEELIQARTEGAAAFFSRQYQGELSRALQGILDLAVPGRPPPADRREGARRLRELVLGAGSVARLGQPLRLLIAGRPNSGKSTLFNALVERERVIVSEQRGTTRDFIRETVAIGDWAVELADSVGLRSSPEDPVEREAVERLWREEADAVLYLVAPPWKLADEELSFVARFPPETVLQVANFTDRGRPADAARFAVEISGLRREGLDRLREAIRERWLGPADSPLSAAPFTARQLELLETALGSWESADETTPLDALREPLIICLGSSWPLTNDARETP
ncbi:MAG: 50S ribosome-binding GTPase [Planctomycetota bacterium]|nr:50S ribosome-binding GTPase [Planctomycetota bacterium]